MKKLLTIVGLVSFLGLVANADTVTRYFYGSNAVVGTALNSTNVMITNYARVKSIVMTYTPNIGVTNVPWVNLWDSWTNRNYWTNVGYVTVNYTNGPDALNFGGNAGTVSGTNSAGVTNLASTIFTNGYLVPGIGTYLTTNLTTMYTNLVPLRWRGQVPTNGDQLVLNYPMGLQFINGLLLQITNFDYGDKVQVDILYDRQR